MTDHSNKDQEPASGSERRNCRQGPALPGVHYYFTETGLMVMTERYLKERGYCCKNGCRHCPYGYNGKNKKQPGD